MNFVAKEQNIIVVQLGSHSTRVGIADHLVTPKVVFDTASYVENNLQSYGKNLPQNETTKYPIKVGKVVDWDTLADLCKYILVHYFQVQRMRNEMPVLVAVPPHWSKDDLEHLTQIMFEYLNVPGLYVAHQPLLALYGVGSLTGLCVDIGHETIDVTPVIETSLQQSSAQTLHVGGADIEQYLLTLLKLDAIFMKEYKSEPTIHLARAIKESKICCTFKSAAIVAARTGAGELRAEFEYDGKKFTVGSARYECVEVLFNPSLVGKDCLSIGEAMYLAVTSNIDSDKRLSLWESIVLTGGVCMIAGLENRLETEVAPMISASEMSHEFQAKEVKFLHIPEYFTVYKNLPVETSFLGGCVVARLVFPDSRNYVNKNDYNEMGPAAVHLKSC